MSDAAIVPIILCGGAGTRLWPVSRKDFAKRHAPILQGFSPLQRTLQRLADRLFAPAPAVAGQPARFLLAEQAAAVGVAVEMLRKPEGRDTAAAIAAAAALIARRRRDAVAMAFPSDHLIADAAAARAAQDGHIVAPDVRPTGPETGFGYIRPEGAPGADALRGGARAGG